MELNKNYGYYFVSYFIIKEDNVQNMIIIHIDKYGYRNCENYLLQVLKDRRFLPKKLSLYFIRQSLYSGKYSIRRTIEEEADLDTEEKVMNLIDTYVKNYIMYFKKHNLKNIKGKCTPEPRVVRHKTYIVKEK